MDVSDPTLIMGLHGVFHRHPWVDRVLAENDLADEDVFGLAVARAEAYGWSSTHLGRGPLDGCRWGHNDAGEDWTEDNRVRQLARLQVAVEEQLHGRRLPLLPVATVLGDVLHHRAHDVNVLILERSLGRLDIHPDKPAALAGRLAPSLVGEVQTDGMRNSASIHCSLPAWSLETAIWATEVTATAVHDAGVMEPVLLTISRNGDHPQPNA
ncbi:hypothetical protein ABWJ92_28690 [Streptomyces sp. NPDC000609]|uniref:hypothetical protein n=1 Tax=Streptomyces sp. NPDC000609 TaxID=3160957 RepID=UPI0033955556